MVEKISVSERLLLVGWLVSAGLLAAILLLNRGLFWLYGFPDDLAAFMVTVAGIGIVVLMFMMVRRHVPDWITAPPWVAFKSWKRRQIILYWLVWGWLLAAFFELHNRIEEPILSFTVTFEDALGAFIFGAIVGGFMAFYVLGQRFRRHETLD